MTGAEMIAQLDRAERLCNEQGDTGASALATAMALIVVGRVLVALNAKVDESHRWGEGI